MQTVTLPTIDLPSGPVTLRRLGVDDPFHLLDIFCAAVEAYAADAAYRVNPLPLDTVEGKVRLALLGVQSSTGSAVPWLASLVSMPVEDFRDPNKFPLPALPELLTAIITHPDISGAIATLKRMAANDRILSFVESVKRREAQSNG